MPDDRGGGPMNDNPGTEAQANTAAGLKAATAASIDALNSADHLAVSMFAVVEGPGKNGLELRFVDVDQGEGTEEFDAALVESGLSAYASEDAKYAPFEESLEIKDVIGVLLLDDVRGSQGGDGSASGESPILKLVRDVQGSQALYASGDIPPLEDDDIGRTVGLVFAYSCENSVKPLYAYQKVQPSSIMRQSSFLYRVAGGSRFRLFTEESIKIGRSFDFLIVDDSLLVLKPGTIETQFSYQKVLQRKARVVVGEIERLVDGAKHISAKVDADRRRVVRKLLRIESSPVMRMSASDLRARLESEDLYHGVFRFGPDDRVIVDEDNVTSVLKMLDDELLRSPITDVVYESEIKVRYEQPTTER